MTLLQQIQECFKTNKSFVTGYTYIYQFMTERNEESNAEKIIDLFSKEVYAKAKKYNNNCTVDKETYDNEANQMMKMCEFIQRYHLSHHNNKDMLTKIVNDSWDKAEKNKSLSMIGYICIQNDLPSGDPCWMAKMIGEYV
jgi:hypothetical protein